MLRSSLVLAALVTGCVPPGSIGVEQAPIVGGTTDSGDPGVVLVIAGDLNGSQGVGLCTGEVLSPHVVLTAGHCIVSRTGPYNIYVGNDLNRIQPSDLLPATANRHPMYPYPFGSSEAPMEYDVSVLVLSTPVGSDVTPIPYNKTVDPNTLTGGSLRLVGFGTTGSTSPNDTSSGIKRTVMSTLSSVQQYLLEFDDVRHNTCEGDSGGPALAMINGVETIVGITSFGESAPGAQSCDGAGFDTRVDLYSDFIQPFIDTNDPPPAPMPGQPGSVGYSCTQDTDCNSMICANMPHGYCTAMCDPYTAGSCPSGLHCSQVGKDPSQGYVCEKNARANGCDYGAEGAPAGAFALLLLMLGLALRRRFSN
jgi:MYXO-CTERM domain-containing protein